MKQADALVDAITPPSQTSFPALLAILTLQPKSGSRARALQMSRERGTRHRCVQCGTHCCPNTAHPPCRARLHRRWHTHPPPHLYHTTRISEGRRHHRHHRQTHVPPSPPHSAIEIPPLIPFPPTPLSTLLSRLQPRRNPGTILQAPSSCRRGCIQPILNPARPPRRRRRGPPTPSCSPATAPTPQRRWF